MIFPELNDPNFEKIIFDYFSKNENQYQSLISEGNRCKFKKDSKKTITLAQLFVKNFSKKLLNNDVNRGLLCWHSTGSGKTCLATGAMESFKGKKINSRKSSNEVSKKLDLLWEDEFYKSQLEHVSRLIAEANNTMVLETGLEMYQTLLSQLLELQRPYDALGLKAIPKGLCKWLGAWGGDMLLMNKIFLEQYEAELNEFNIQPWNEVIAKP